MPDFSEQKKTLAECRRLLDKYGKCILIRPTGFGKTWMLTELVKDYRHVLYLYPSQVVRDTVVDRYYDLADQDPEDVLDPETVETMQAVGEIPGCDLMTYAKLIRLSDDEIKAMDYELVICDEAHRMGGPKTKIACEKLFAMLPVETKFIGATATPTRMDNFDVASHFYMDRMCYPYTLHDAIQSGLVMRPYYCYATYDFRKDLENAATDAGEDLRDPHVQSTITAKMIELGNLYNMPGIIRSVCDQYAARTDYMKFIIFFANKKHMREKCQTVESWFREAYPDHEIKTLRITSFTAEEKTNTDKLPLLKPVKNRIDLIACIDMLNMGYHVNDQTGILMYRGTESGTVFTQQFGRALSAGAGSSAIIFDIVDNLHRKAVYELYVKDPSQPSTRRRRMAEPKLDNLALDEASGRIYATGPDGEWIPTQYHYDGRHVRDRQGNASTFKLDKNNDIRNTSDALDSLKNINRLEKADLIATGHEATYREILAKAMAEPLAHRCKYAVQLHFCSWCRNHGVEYPISAEKLSELYGLDITDFYSELKKIIKAGKIMYPLQDAEKLLRIGADGSDPPLAVCCQATGVTIEQLMELLFQ